NYQLIPSETTNYSGSSNNLNFNIQLNRRSQGPDPIFPTSGSDMQLSLRFTPPYSIFRNIDYTNLSTEERFRWLEFYKVRFNAYWYQEIVGKLVIKAGGEFGILSAYNRNLGVSPFERFYMGGSGLAIGRIDGREIITLRGYKDSTNAGGGPVDVTPLGGGVAFNKFMMEFRYPITMGNTAKIWALSFLEAGSIWGNTAQFDPFKLKKSVGVGVRVFMPAFGLLGLDLGYGFDKVNSLSNDISGRQIHFVIGQQF
ncbi:MAG: outer membrane protein assembly factor BamA, partial [Solirubrobacteraceae bacterium]